MSDDNGDDEEGNGDDGGAAFAFEQWLVRCHAVPLPSLGKWRNRSLAHIGQLVERARREDPAISPMALASFVDKRYPFERRSGFAYKAWLAERKIFHAALRTDHAPRPSADERDACEVARDLVELGKVDDAQKLLDEQAPNRLNQKCQSCGAWPGEMCKEPVTDKPGHYSRRSSEPVVVPHMARLLEPRTLAEQHAPRARVPADDGPLFSSR